MSGGSLIIQAAQTNLVLTVDDIKQAAREISRVVYRSDIHDVANLIYPEPATNAAAILNGFAQHDRFIIAIDCRLDPIMAAAHEVWLAAQRVNTEDYLDCVVFCVARRQRDCVFADWWSRNKERFSHGMSQGRLVEALDAVIEADKEVRNLE